MNLDYIQGMGFDAITISPIPTTGAGGYDGFGALDWEKVNPNFGTSEELTNLIQKCHEKDIWVMLDVVANHSSELAKNYSDINPLNKAEYYNKQCKIVEGDQTSTEECWLSNHPDLNQENKTVSAYLNSWVEQVVSRYDFDGVNIQAVNYVFKDFWPEYTQAAGVF
jgi:alpha-amylase